MTEKQLTILEEKITLLKEYQGRAPKHKKSLLARLIELYEGKVNQYYARLSLIR